MPARRRKPFVYPGPHTAYPKQSRCSTCGQDVLKGSSLGLSIVFDPWGLSQIGELEALMRQVRTFHALRPYVARRNSVSIANTPIPYTGAVLREHRCHTPPPTGNLLAPPKKTEQLPDECPF